MKPRNAVTMPTEASPPMHKDVNGTANKAARQDKEDESSTSLLPRIHLPGHRHRHSRDLRDGGSKEKDKDGLHHHLSLRHVGSHKHRHTKSEVPPGHAIGKGGKQDLTLLATNSDPVYLTPSAAAGKGSGIISRVATNLSGKPTHEHKHHKPRHQYSSSDVHRGFHAGAAAALTGNAGRPDLRRRATSDPRASEYSRTGFQRPAKDGAEGSYGMNGQAMQQKPQAMTEIEVLLYKAEKTRRDAEQNVSMADVQRMSTQIAESNVELQGRLAGTDRTASQLMRRLDDVHDTLLRTASSLIHTISSFQNLCLQSSALITNFEKKAGDLNGEMRTMLKKQRTAIFDERAEKIALLEGRGNRANERAEEMSRRLENCRTIVQNYMERERTKRRAWKGVLMGVSWGCVLILTGVLMGLGLWWYKRHAGSVSHDVHEAVALALDQRGLGGVHGHVHNVVKERLEMQSLEASDGITMFGNVPEDVKALLEDIAVRHNGTFEEGSTTVQHTEPSPDRSLDQDKKLNNLFDKLEL